MKERNPCKGFGRPMSQPTAAKYRPINWELSEYESNKKSV